MPRKEILANQILKILQKFNFCAKNSLHEENTIKAFGKEHFLVFFKKLDVGG